jgi:hypothetical protein
MASSSQTFWQQAGRIINAGQSRSVLLTGNVNDLFPVEGADGELQYVPVVQALIRRWDVPRYILVVYELNGPIRFVHDGDQDIVRDTWLQWRTGMDKNALDIRVMLSSDRMKTDLKLIGQSFDDNLRKSVGSPTMALEVLRQMCLCSRSSIQGKPLLDRELLIVIEAADMVIPDSPVSQMRDADRQRAAICHDWFSDPEFTEAGDAVVLITESRSLINHRIAQLPQVLEVEAPSPDFQARRQFIHWFEKHQMPGDAGLKLWGTVDDLATSTAGLSIHALRQLLKGTVYADYPLSRDDTIAKVEAFIQSQMGEDVVEFKKPAHSLEQVVGFTKLKAFLSGRLMPRFRSSGPDALPGAAVSGPIGSGKTFIFEAVAAELDMVVLVLKNIRSQWYGQTDVIFERLRRVLVALDKVLIFVDEADTQFGGVGAETHATERRLTGKIQAMMSDTQLRGRVLWLLMTARIHLLSPDIRRPGRVGDLIIPILDPEGDDRRAFLQWMVKPVHKDPLTDADYEKLEDATTGFYSAAYASMRAELKARAGTGILTLDEVLEVLRDYLSPDIGPARRYQTLQALLNCTRRSLLPDPDVTEEQRAEWAAEIRALERAGIR